MITAAVVAGSFFAGCDGGGGDDADADSTDPPASTEPTTTTTAPARIDLSQPIPGGSLHGRPRPPLENTGDDYVAIFESLVANFRWLTENPDPTLLSEIFVPGTPGHDERVPAYQYLVDNEYRWADEGYALVSVSVASVAADVVAINVVDQVEFERLIDPTGDQVGDTRPHAGPENSSVLLSPDESGRWRIASWQRGAPAEVEL